MKSSLITLLSFVIVLSGTTYQALATPNRGYTCVGCHGSSAPDGYNDNRLTLQNTTGTIDPVERVGATDRGTLPYYQVTAGNTATLTLLTNGAISPNYGFLTDNYQKPGVVNNNTISWTLDGAWFQQTSGSGPFWYRTSYSSGTSYKYNMAIPSSVLPDYYEFEMGWAGNGGNDAGLKRFYIQVLAALSQWSNPAGGNWTLGTNWTGGVPNAIGANVNFGSAITSNATVTLDASATAGSINFNNSNAYTLAGANTLTMDVASGQASLTVQSGSHTIAAPLTLADDTTITVTPAASVLTISGAMSANGKTITKAGAGITRFANVRAVGLNVSAGTVGVLANGGDSGVSRVTTLTLAGGATPTSTIDLNDNDLIITGGSLTTVVAQVANARSGGAWDQGGITSSAARTQPQGATTLGVLLGSDYNGMNGATIAGFTVSAADVIVKYTWYGDSDFNGAVDFDDYVRIDQGFNLGLTGWQNGDFDLNGAVDFDDYVYIDLAYNVQNQTLIGALNWLTGEDRSPSTAPGIAKVIEHFQQFGLEYANAFIAAVPEPAMLGSLAIVAILIRRRRI